MAIKLSGPLSFSTDIVGEFEDTAPHSISEFYDGAGLVPAGANPNVPSSGAVSFSNFYGAVNVVTISIINNQYDSDGTLVTLDKGSTLNLFEIANKTIGSNAGNNVVVPFVFSLDSDTVFNNSIIFGGSFTDITIENNGIIAGRGGHGTPLSSNAYTKINYGNNVGITAGNAAIFIDSDQTKVTITNLEKGFIAGGGNQAEDGSNIASATTPFRLYGNGDASEGPSSAEGGQGYGGGWNGGRGGQARRVVSAEVGRNLKSDDPSNRDPNNGSGFNTIVNGGAGSFVTGRDVDISGNDGVITGTLTKYARFNSDRLLSRTEVTGMPVATRAFGGSGLNGGEKGQAHAVAINSGTNGISVPESLAQANSASGSGGGSGIGTSAIPYFQVSPASVANSNAGGGHSIQIKTGSTVSTKSTINNGRIYGDTDIAIS